MKFKVKFLRKRRKDKESGQITDENKRHQARRVNKSKRKRENKCFKIGAKTKRKCMQVKKEVMMAKGRYCITHLYVSHGM